MPPANYRPDVHGHRGCRGLMPENTVPGFLKALELGCDWVEMDVVINASGEVLVSHEPWMDHRNCLDRNGRSIAPEHERLLNIYHMTMADVAQYDCGTLEDPDFPEREHVKATKPLLAEVVDQCDTYAAENAMSSAHYNIEIKSDPALYDQFQPQPRPYAERVMAAIDSIGIIDRCIIQSFDPAVLEEVHRIEPAVPIALLIDHSQGLEADLARLSFTPAMYSPSHELVDAAMVSTLYAKDIELVVWTVNSEADMRRMLDLGVDAIITDYPDRLWKLIDELP